MKLLINYFNSVGEWAHHEQVNFAIQILRSLKINNDIIDLGCGDGNLSLKIKEALKTTRFSAIDASGRYKKIVEDKGIKFLKRDLNTTLRIRNRFNAAVSLQTIEHIIDVDLFLKEVLILLKRNRPFIVATENLASWHNIFALFLGIQPFTGPYLSKKHPIGWHPLNKSINSKKAARINKLIVNPHVNVMTTKALIEILNKSNFRVTKVYGMGYYPFPIFLGRILSRIDPYHSAYCVVVAIKK